MLSTATEYPAIELLVLINKLREKGSSAVVLLRDEAREGEVHVQHGRVVRASSSSLDGEQALFGMLNWPSPRMWVAPLFEAPEVNVFSDLNFLAGGTFAESPA